MSSVNPFKVEPVNPKHCQSLKRCQGQGRHWRVLAFLLPRTILFAVLFRCGAWHETSLFWRHLKPLQSVNKLSLYYTLFFFGGVCNRRIILRPWSKTRVSNSLLIVQWIALLSPLWRAPFKYITYPLQHRQLGNGAGVTFLIWLKGWKDIDEDLGPAAGMWCKGETSKSCCRDWLGLLAHTAAMSVPLLLLVGSVGSNINKTSCQYSYTKGQLFLIFEASEQNTAENKHFLLEQYHKECEHCVILFINMVITCGEDLLNSLCWIHLLSISHLFIQQSEGVCFFLKKIHYATI